MKLGVIEEILTPKKRLSSNVFARWNSETESVIISWHGTEYSTTLNNTSGILETEEEFASALLQWAYEKIPVHQDEPFHSHTYSFWDASHQRECLVVARSGDVGTHRCITGTTPAINELPFYKQPTVTDFSSHVRGSIVCIESEHFIPASVLTLTREEILTLINPKFTSTYGVCGLYLPNKVFFGTEDAMRRYKDTDITGEALFLTGDRIQELLTGREGQNE